MKQILHCRVCRASISRLQARLYDTTCDNWRCRQTYFIDLHRRQAAAHRVEEERHRARADRAESLSNRLLESGELPVAKTFKAFPVPANVLDLAAVPEDRRERFREHLRSVIRVAFAPGDSSAASGDSAPQDGVAEADPESLVIEQAACAACRGRCCLHGGDQAYLSPDTIRRYRIVHSGATEESTFEDYASRLADTGYSESCIFHQREGCGLPSTMRSESCNWFACSDLRDVQRRRRECLSADGVLFFALDDDPVVYISLERREHGFSAKSGEITISTSHRS